MWMVIITSSLLLALPTILLLKPLDRMLTLLLKLPPRYQLAVLSKRFASLMVWFIR